MPIKLLVHKSWHVYSAENIAKVKRDEAKARGEEEESDRRSMLADSEARLDRMRKKRKKDHDGKGEGEKALDRQLKGLGPPGADDEREVGGTVIIRPDKGKAKEAEAGPAAPLDPGKHINFWSEFEAGAVKTTSADHEAALQKVIEKEKMDEYTKMYLAKKGEGDMRGWYAREDLKTDREVKEGVEGNLERAYKDGEHKRLADPLALMNSFLKRRKDVLSGAPISRLPPPSSRDRYPSATPQTERGDLSPVITSLLSAKRRRGEPFPPPPEPHAPRTSTASSSTSNNLNDPAAEAKSRVSSERARAAALLAERKRATAAKNGSSLASETPRSESGSEWGPGGYGMFNKQETREAQERRSSGWGHGASGGGSWGRNEGGGSSGGWGDQKRRRDEKERGGVRERRW